MPAPWVVNRLIVSGVIHGKLRPRWDRHKELHVFLTLRTESRRSFRKGGTRLYLWCYCPPGPAATRLHDYAKEGMRVALTGELAPSTRSKQYRMIVKRVTFQDEGAPPRATGPQ